MDPATLADRLDIPQEAAEALPYMDGEDLFDLLNEHFLGSPGEYRILDFKITSRHYSEEHGEEISTSETERRADHRLQNQMPEAAHTLAWKEHPAGYEGPCICQDCLDYATE